MTQENPTHSADYGARLIDRLRTYKTQTTCIRDGYDVIYGTETMEVPRHEATLIGSRLRESREHLLVLDIDLPVEVHGSKTPGHHHVIFGQPMSWWRYKRTVKALAKAGVVDREWARATVRGGNGFIAATRVIPPGGQS